MPIKAGIILTLTFFLFSITAKATDELDLSDVGVVALENSGAPEAQQAFLHGLAQLHNFQYGDAAADFQAAQAIDPDFALAFWGEALSYTHAIWMEKDLDAALAALNKYAPSPKARQEKAPTEFARDLLGAIDMLYGPGTKEEQDDLYMVEMARLYAKYPDNVEVASMYALSIMGTAHEGREFALYMEAAAIVTEFLEVYPEHPGLNHYLIHATDDPVHAILGLRAARAYSKIAPNAGHPQHMTSHIFLALGLWDDVISANVRAVDIDNRQRDEPSAHQFTCGHYTSWLMYGYLQVGKRDNAFEIMKMCHQGLAETGPEKRRGVYYYSWMRNLFLNDTQEWEGEVADMEMNFNSVGYPAFENAFVNTLIPIKRGDFESAKSALSKAMEVAGQMTNEWNEEGLPEGDNLRTELKVMVNQLKGQILLLGGTPEGALKLLRQAVALEMDLPVGFGPPSPAKPSLELLGEVLIELGQYPEAKEVLSLALSRTKGKARTLAALARAEAGLQTE